MASVAQNLQVKVEALRKISVGEWLETGIYGGEKAVDARQDLLCV